MKLRQSLRAVTGYRPGPVSILSAFAVGGWVPFGFSVYLNSRHPTALGAFGDGRILVTALVAYAGAALTAGGVAAGLTIGGRTLAETRRHNREDESRALQNSQDERFSRSVEQVSSASAAVRRGSLYSLQRLAVEGLLLSRTDLTSAGFESLCSYLRQAPEVFEDTVNPAPSGRCKRGRRSSNPLGRARYPEAADAGPSPEMLVRRAAFDCVKTVILAMNRSGWTPKVNLNGAVIEKFRMEGLKLDSLSLDRVTLPDGAAFLDVQVSELWIGRTAKLDGNLVINGDSSIEGHIVVDENTVIAGNIEVLGRARIASMKLRPGARVTGVLRVASSARLVAELDAASLNQIAGGLEPC